jgi:hypothetical protein
MNFLTEYFKQRINSENQCISLGCYSIELYFAIQVIVYRTDTVNVIVKCSSTIILDFGGIMRLTEGLRIEERLAATLTDPMNKTYNAEFNLSEIKIPNKDDWIITH